MLLSSRVLLGCAAPMGAAGVMLAAMATHLAGGGILSTAALFLLLHAAAVAGLAAMAPHLQARGRAALVGAAGLIIAGTLLFSVDLALRQLAGTKLLWGTAPFGGGAMIVGWLGVAIAALMPER